MTQPNWLKNLQVTRVALCGKGMNPEAEIALYKSAETTTHQGGHTVATDDTVAKSDHDAVVAELESAQAELAALTEMSNEDLAALRGIDVAPVAEVEDDVLKGLPEAIRERLEKAEAEAAENAERIAKMEAENRAKAFLAKAAEYEHVAPAADLAPVLETLDRVAPDAAKALDQALKAANARIAESDLLKELGADGDAGADPKAKAEALIAAEVEKGLPRQEAMAQVFKAHPELLYPAAQ
jgi:hypothetical protein